MLPLLAVADGMPTPHVMAAPAAGTPALAAAFAPDDLRIVRAFRSRAPPR
jgi:hypothetical protein